MLHWLPWAVLGFSFPGRAPGRCLISSRLGYQRYPSLRDFLTCPSYRRRQTGPGSLNISARRGSILLGGEAGGHPGRRGKGCAASGQSHLGGAPVL